MALHTALMVVVTGALLCPVANAQFGIRFDINNHVVRDRHGHVIGGSVHGPLHPEARYYSGGYSVRNGVQLYYPQTAGVGNVAVAPPPEQVSFGGFGHVDDLALRLETLMNDLCLDLYYNYSHNPGFHETYTEAYSLLQTAKFIHDAEHHSDRDAIRSRLGGADALFHHIQDDVRGWTRIHHRQIGTLGILTKMEMTEDTLHHLMNDVGVAPGGDLRIPQASGGVEVAPPPGTRP